MFVRIWSKFENVGRENCGLLEHYVAIRYIMRFYRRRYEGDAADRHMVATSTETSYVTKETFEYLKRLRNQNVYEHRDRPDNER